MSNNVIPINKQKKDSQATEETKVDETFDAIIERNRKTKEQLEKLRAEQNRRVIASLGKKGNKK